MWDLLSLADRQILYCKHNICKRDGWRARRAAQTTAKQRRKSEPLPAMLDFTTVAVKESTGRIS